MSKDGGAAEFGWRVHDALDSWTGKVDTKASIALAIESAMFGFAVSLSQDGRTFSGLTDQAECWFYAGLGLLLSATSLALAVVVPQLRRYKSRKSGEEWRTGLIYFGHLRHWETSELAKALRNGPPEVDQLANQLVAMARIAWRKHSFLQASLLLLAAGIACLVLVAAFG